MKKEGKRTNQNKQNIQAMDKMWETKKHEQNKTNKQH